MSIKYLEFDPHIASEKQFKDAIAIQLERFKERNPNDSPLSTDMIQEQLIMLSESSIFKPHLSLAYNKEGESVGIILIAFGQPDSPDYEHQQHIGVIDLFVRPDHRRQGIGTDLLRYATQYLQEHNKTLMQGSTEQEGGRAFANLFGAQIGLNKRENRLYLEDIDWEMVALWQNTGTEVNRDVQIELFKGLPPDIDIDAYSTLYTEVFNQQPLDETEGLEITWTPERIRQIHERQTKIGITNYIMISREPDGTLSGLTEMVHNPKRGHRISQGLTGVHENYRGRGIGKWLKAKMLIYMQENFPNVKFVSTQNAMSNNAMNSINERLGFKLYRHSTMFKIKVEKLARKINIYPL